MNKEDVIDNLRKSISDAEDSSIIGDEFAAMIKHPKLTWNDLIGFLRFKILIGEYASFKLHDFLDIPISPNGPIRDQKEWYKILKERQINPLECIQENIKNHLF